MCRWAAYCGDPVYIEDVIAAPSHSLIQQSHAASECKTAINGDGFGLAWYGDHEEPGIYCDILPAWSDRNLRNIARMVRSSLFLAHVRASTGTPTSRQNCHPFGYGKWSFMHNGQIGHFEKMRRSLETLLPDELSGEIRGSTDSELIFLLSLKNGLEQSPHQALQKTVKEIEHCSAKLGIPPLLRLTAAFSDGKTLFAVRYSSDTISPTLYVSDCTISNGLCIVSEPLDHENANWQSIPTNRFLTLADGKLQQTEFINTRSGEKLNAAE